MSCAAKSASTRCRYIVGGAQNDVICRLAMISRMRSGSARSNATWTTVAPSCHCPNRPPHAAFAQPRSEEHTSELQSLMRISYAVFCLKKKNLLNNHIRNVTASTNDILYVKTCVNGTPELLGYTI